MPITKRILCLANSRKGGARCVAGIEIKDRQALGWIRPVGDRATHAVWKGERRYANGDEPRPLDIIDVPLINHYQNQELCYQGENWLIDPNLKWKKVKESTALKLKEKFDPSNRMNSNWIRCVSAEGPLWINGYSKNYCINDLVPVSLANNFERSLLLILVPSLQVRVLHDRHNVNRRRVLGSFSHLGESYSLWIRDAVFEDRYLEKADGTYKMKECLLTVSLGEPFNGFCYKLIAGIIEC